jgi:hypothetical protein
MFGFFSKSPDKKTIYEIVMRSALIVYHSEKTSGLYQHPDVVKMTVDAVTKNQSVSLSQEEKFRADSCTMAVLMREEFIECMYQKYGVNSFSKYLFSQDGYSDLDLIIGKYFR